LAVAKPASEKLYNLLGDARPRNDAVKAYLRIVGDGEHDRG